MSKARKSNREAKKQPAMTMKEKRAARKSKAEDKGLLGSENTARRPTTGPAAKGPRRGATPPERGRARGG